MSTPEKKKVDTVDIVKSVKDFGVLHDIFVESDASLAKYKGVMAAMGKVIMEIKSPNGGDYLQAAKRLSDIVARFNDEGTNLEVKDHVSTFSSRVCQYSPTVIGNLLNEINSKDGGRFLSLLERYGHYVDPVKEEERRKREAEERRRREEEERRKREAEERRRREEEERRKREAEERRRREEEERRKREAEERIRREEEERRKREAEERRRREEEERRKREAEERRREEEERRKPRNYVVAYCTACGTKFNNIEFRYCPQCGNKRHAFTVVG